MFILLYLQIVASHFLLPNSPDAQKVAEGIYVSNTGTVSFTSDAPLELIEAQSNKLIGALNTADKSFLFNIKMNTFEGFNSSLQRTHFNENYVESEKFPKAEFNGKIIEDLDFSKTGTYTVRAKGNLVIHGVTEQRIIKSTLVVGKSSLKITSAFTILLEEHNIKIPAVVNQKLAEEISVKVELELKPKK